MEKVSDRLREHADVIDDVGRAVADHVDEVSRKLADHVDELSYQVDNATYEASRAAPRLEERWKRFKSALSEYAADPAKETEGIARAFDGLAFEARRFLRRASRPKRFRFLPWR